MFHLCPYIFSLSLRRVSSVVSTVLIPKTNSALGFSAGFRCVAFSSLHQTSFNLTQSLYPANRVLTLHKSDCVWQNGGASSRFLHIDFPRINYHPMCQSYVYSFLFQFYVRCLLIVLIDKNLVLQLLWQKVRWVVWQKVGREVRFGRY